MLMRPGMSLLNSKTQQAANSKPSCSPTSLLPQCTNINVTYVFTETKAASTTWHTCCEELFWQRTIMFNFAHFLSLLLHRKMTNPYRAPCPCCLHIPTATLVKYYNIMFSWWQSWACITIWCSFLLHLLLYLCGCLLILHGRFFINAPLWTVAKCCEFASSEMWWP